jgi:hypothetical protein
MHPRAEAVRPPPAAKPEGHLSHPPPAPHPRQSFETRCPPWRAPAPPPPQARIRAPGPGMGSQSPDWLRPLTVSPCCGCIMPIPGTLNHELKVNMVRREGAWPIHWLATGWAGKGATRPLYPSPCFPDFCTCLSKYLCCDTKYCGVCMHIGDDVDGR